MGFPLSHQLSNIWHSNIVDTNSISFQISTLLTINGSNSQQADNNFTLFLLAATFDFCGLLMTFANLGPNRQNSMQRKQLVTSGLIIWLYWTVTEGLWVKTKIRPHPFRDYSFPTADSRRAVVSYWWIHWVQSNLCKTATLNRQNKGLNDNW